jgi:hypothetical protein
MTDNGMVQFEARTLSSQMPTSFRPPAVTWYAGLLFFIYHTSKENPHSPIFIIEGFPLVAFGLKKPQASIPGEKHSPANQFKVFQPGTTSSISHKVLSSFLARTADFRISLSGNPSLSFSSDFFAEINVS